MSNRVARKTFSIKRAHYAQRQLSKRIIVEDRLPARIRLIAGVDVTYTKRTSIGAAVVLNYSSLKCVESQTSICGTPFPYIPTLLSFREIPPSLLCIKKLRSEPDVLLVDGQGLAHPYRCGFASHLGLVMNRPTIGVAKTRLFGEIEKTAEEEGVTHLKHDDEVIGAVITTQPRTKPVYVSVGHMVSLNTAIKIVKHCITGNQLPQPLLRAHQAASEQKRKLNIV